jgi:hypothetical protein
MKADMLSYFCMRCTTIRSTANIILHVGPCDDLNRMTDPDAKALA